MKKFKLFFASPALLFLCGAGCEPQSAVAIFHLTHCPQKSFNWPDSKASVTSKFEKRPYEKAVDYCENSSAYLVMEKTGKGEQDWGEYKASFGLIPSGDKCDFAVVIHYAGHKVGNSLAIETTTKMAKELPRMIFGETAGPERSADKILILDNPQTVADFCKTVASVPR